MADAADPGVELELVSTQLLRQILDPTAPPVTDGDVTPDKGFDPNNKG